jgi:hypothetical protein
MSSHPHSDDGSSLATGKPMPTDTAPSRAGEPGPVTEGGKVPFPKEGKGEPKASASAAHANGALDEGTTKGVVGKAEKEEAAQKGALKDQHGRGHRKED